ncbi:MAG: hypothetical protein KAT43_02245 [Nanoarchaeota archaeon]|nr:hypothetical protein [Nanoarchaeota archaeon]
MAQYLFAYPIREYFDEEIESSSFDYRGGNATKLMGIINARYRNYGYGINWLFFGKPDDTSVPDTESASSIMDIREEDGILVAGVKFRPEFRESQYPNPYFILDQLPSHKILVLGGFHWQDCVDRIAKASYERGIDTFVDEDTTDKFFYREGIQDIPLIRTVWTLRELNGEMPDEDYEFAVEFRKNKPWVVQK